MKPRKDKTMEEKSLEEVMRLSEAIVFRWYALAQEEHDMISGDGLDMLHNAIQSVLIEEGAVPIRSALAAERATRKKGRK